MENKILKLMLDKLESIERKLETIELEIKVIKNNTQVIQSSTSNMDTHISFVENIYDSVKTPFYYVVNSFSTNKIEPLEQIKLIK